MVEAKQSRGGGGMVPAAPAIYLWDSMEAVMLWASASTFEAISQSSAMRNSHRELQQLWTACDAERDNPKYGAFWYSHRGPIRHPWAYRFFSFTMVPAFLFFFGNFVLWDVTLQMHLKLCEIRDLTDEVQRRTGRARGTG